MNKFAGFAGRVRETERLFEMIKASGALDDLPPDLVEFVKRNYNPLVPYHNTVHVLSGILYLHQRQAPLTARVAWAGHDAGHDGSAIESPEVVSAVRTYEWLKANQKWLETSKINPQDPTEAINDTRFPYGWPRRSDVSGWVRLADTLRIASGDHAEVIGGGTPFLAYFYESARFCDELHAAKKLLVWNPRGDVLVWLEKGQVGFFFNTLKTDVLSGDRFSGATWNILGQLHDNQQYLRTLLASDAGREKLLSGYDFLGHDVPSPEFVAHCQSIGL